MVFYGDRKRGYAQKQHAGILVLIELITLGSEKIIDNSRTLLYFLDVERDKRLV